MEYSKKYEQLSGKYNALVGQLESLKKATEVKFFNKGENYFNSLTKHLYETIKADYAFVGLLENGSSIRTLSFFTDGKHLPNFSYKLKGTPCSTIVGHETCTYADNVHLKFPKDHWLNENQIRGYCGAPLFDSKENPVGIIVGLFKNAISNADFIEILLMSHAHKAGSEIEHQFNYEKINEINGKLKKRNIKLKKNELLQQRLNKRIEFALKTSKSAWFELTFPSGKLLYNKTLASKLGFDIDKIIKYEDFIDTIHPDERRESFQKIDQYIEKGSGRFEIKFRVKTADKQYRWFNLTGEKQVPETTDIRIHFIGIVADISSEVENQQIKNELEHNYYQLIKNFPNGSILLYDKNLKFQISGGPKLEKAGFTEEKVIGKTIYEILPKNICNKIEHAYKDSLSGKETTLEVELDGDWHRTINIPNRNTNGQITGGIVMTQNITKEKKALQDLKISNSRMQSLIEATNIVAWELDLNSSKFTYVSPQIESLCGYPMHKWSDIHFWISIIHKDDRFRTIESFRSETMNGHDHNFEYRVITKDKNIKWISDIASVTQVEDQPKYLRGFFIDITTQKESELKLKYSEEKFKLAFYTSPDAVNINKLDSTFVEVNDSFCSIMLYSRDEVIGKTSADLNLWNNEQNKTVLLQELHERGFVNNLQVEFRKKNGEIVVGLMSASLIKFNNEDHVISITRDMTDKILIQAKLKESEKKYRSTFEAINEGLWDWDVLSGKGYFSESFYKMLGYNINDVENTNEAWQKLIHPDDFISCLDILDNHLKGESPEFSIEFRMKAKTSEYKWVKAKGRIMEFTDDQKPKRIFAAIEDIDVIKKTELELELSLTKYKTLAEYTYDWEYWKDPDNNFIYVSPSTKRITGYEPEHFLNDKNLFRSIIHSDDLEIWDAHEHKSMHKRIPCKKPIEIRIKCKNGKIVWINHICQPVYDNQGKYIGNRGTNRNITEQKSTELSLIASESKYRLLFENMTSGFALHKMIYDENDKPKDYTFQEVNPAFEKITGLNKADILGQNIKKVMPDLEDYWIQTYGEIAKFGESTYYENYSKELNKYFSTYVFSPEKDKFAVIFHDISEKKQIEEELIRSENKLKLHLEQTPLGVIEWGVNSEIISWNNAAEEIFGYSFEEIEGKIGISQLVPEEYQKEIENVWEQTLRKGNKRNTNRNRTKDGRIIICDWYNTTIINDDNKIIGVISMVEDVTERERIQHELRESEERHKMISRIASDYVYSMQVSNQNDQYFIDWVSGGFTRITGYTVGEINKMKYQWDSIIYPEDKSKIKESQLKSKLLISKTLEYRIVAKNGNIVWIADKSIPMADMKGNTTRYLGSVTNITERKLAEESLRKSEERLKRLSKISKEGILIHDHGVAIEVNDALSKITGYSNKELLGKNVIESVIHKEDLEKAKYIINKSMDLPYRVRAVSKDGTVFDAEIHSQPYEYDGNTVTTTSIRDITEHIKIEQELKKNEDYLRRAQKIAHIGHWHWDIFKNEYFYSDEFKNIYEIDSDDYALKDIFNNFTHITDKNRILGLFDTVKKSNFKFDEEYRIVVNDKTKWLRGIAEVSCDEDGVPASVLGLSFDITEKKLAEIRIRENDKELIELNKQIANYKMMALRSVMNPHFIFNCLNSIQFFIAKSEKKPAISYLSLFSKLMRNVLNSSVERYVTLRKEIETLQYYVELEKLRFDDNFDFVLDIDGQIDLDTIEIPSMVIQPYIENAIIHGLSNKYDTGTLNLKIEPDKKYLVCTIEDDGIGRKASMKLQEAYRDNHKSYGMTVTEERLNILNKTDNVKVEIIDLENEKEPAGTRVIMKIELRRSN